MRPLIGITCGQHTFGSSSTRCYQNASYVKSFALAGGVPTLIPVLADKAALHAIYQTLDGLLLTGGGDVEPHRYGQARHEKLGATDSLRDEVELTLTHWAFKDDLPVLAICRGIQVLNVALGGTLYQDIASQVPGALVHPYQPGNPRDFLAHRVKLVPHTLLTALFPSESSLMYVNSMHHQAVCDPAPGFIISARSPDGVIEGIEHPLCRFVIGVQWHPEEMVEGYPLMRRLFKGFVQAARR